MAFIGRIGRCSSVTRRGPTCGPSAARSLSRNASAGSMAISSPNTPSSMCQPVALLRLAGDARADNVLPRRQAAFVAWQHVIEVEVALVETLSAILAGVLVAFEDVRPGEFHFLLRQTIENHQHDDPRHA